MAELSPFGAQSAWERVKNVVVDFLDDIFRKKDTSVVGVDVGSSAVKVVQLKKRRGKAILETYGELALGPYGGLAVGQATELPQKKVSAALQDVVREANVSAVQGGIAIPLPQSLVTIIELPSVQRKKLSDVVPIEARRYIPVPISEVTLDWRVVPEVPERAYGGADAKGGGALRKKLKVLIAAIHNEVISRYEKIATASGISIDFLEIEAFSMIRSLSVRGNETLCILDIGAATTKVIITERGVPLQSHVINRGSQDITQALSQSLGISVVKAEELKRKIGTNGVEKKAEDVREAMETVRLIMHGVFSEANRMLLSYERRHNKAIDRILISGGGAMIGGVMKMAKENFETRVALGDPFAKVEAPAFMEAALQAAGPHFTVALGVALRKLQEVE